MGKKFRAGPLLRPRLNEHDECAGNRALIFHRRSKRSGAIKFNWAYDHPDRTPLGPKSIRKHGVLGVRSREGYPQGSGTLRELKDCDHGRMHLGSGCRPFQQDDVDLALRIGLASHQLLHEVRGDTAVHNLALIVSVQDEVEVYGDTRARAGLSDLVPRRLWSGVHACVHAAGRQRFRPCTQRAGSALHGTGTHQRRSVLWCRRPRSHDRARSSESFAATWVYRA